MYIHVHKIHTYKHSIVVPVQSDILQLWKVHSIDGRRKCLQAVVTEIELLQIWEEIEGGVNICYLMCEWVIGFSSW